MEYFDAQKVNKHITCITGLTGELMYLVEGEKSAALIDTGLGVGNLKGFVDSLTHLPYRVLLTHGHLDHVGGAFLYESVCLSAKDTFLLRDGGDKRSRKAYLKSIVKDVVVPDTAYTKYREPQVFPIRDGQLFELGGVTIEAVAFPGHTPGSHAFLLKEDRILITGDACNPRTFMFLPECPSIEEYQEAVAKVMARADEYDRVLVSHGPYEVPKTVLQDVYDCCTDILSDRADDIPFSFMDRTGALLAKKIDETGARVDGRCGNIVYDKTKIRSK